MTLNKNTTLDGSEADPTDVNAKTTYVITINYNIPEDIANSSDGFSYTLPYQDDFRASRVYGSDSKCIYTVNNQEILISNNNSDVSSNLTGSMQVEYTYTGNKSFSFKIKDRQFNFTYHAIEEGDRQNGGVDLPWSAIYNAHVFRKVDYNGNPVVGAVYRMYYDTVYWHLDDKIGDLIITADTKSEWGIESDYYNEYTTDENGEIILDAVSDTNQMYKWVEVSAPGCIVESKPIYYIYTTHSYLLYSAGTSMKADFYNLNPNMRIDNDNALLNYQDGETGGLYSPGGNVHVYNASIDPVPTGDFTIADGYVNSINKLSPTGDKLSGAQLEVLDSSGNVIDSWTTDDKSHQVPDLGTGDYTLRETSAPDGYAIADDITFTSNGADGITVNGKTVDSINMVDDYAYDVDITKMSYDFGVSLAGSHLQVFNSSGKKVDEWVSDTSPHTLSLKAGTYTLHEAEAPTGYDVTTDVQFTVNGKDDVTVNGSKVSDVTITDPLLKFNVSVNKLSDDGSTVSGAALDIVNSNGDVVDSWVSDGSTHVSSLKVGDYTLHESSAPDGYAISDDITFTVNGDNNITVGGATVSSITVTDPVIRYDVQVTKTANNGDTLSGAALQILDNNGAVLDEWTSDGTAHTSRLRNGSYTLHEKSAPDGYIVSDDIKFVVSNGTVTVSGNAVKSVNMVDNLKPTPGVPRFNVDINKIASDTNSNLPGAKLQILDKNGNVVYAWDSDSNKYTASLESGDYTLHEVSAPDGYTAAEDIKFNVSEDGVITIDGKTVDNISMTDNVAEVQTDDSLPKAGDSTSNNSIPLGVMSLVSLAAALFTYKRSKNYED